MCWESLSETFAFASFTTSGHVEPTVTFSLYGWKIKGMTRRFPSSAVRMAERTKAPDLWIWGPGFESRRTSNEISKNFFLYNWRQKFSKSISGIVCPENQLFSASNAQKTSYFQHLMLRKPANFQHSMPWKPIRKFPLLLITKSPEVENKAYNGEKYISVMTYSYFIPNTIPDNYGLCVWDSKVRFMPTNL